METALCTKVGRGEGTVGKRDAAGAKTPPRAGGRKRGRGETGEKTRGGGEGKEKTETLLRTHRKYSIILIH